MYDFLDISWREIGTRNHFMEYYELILLSMTYWRSHWCPVARFDYSHNNMILRSRLKCPEPDCREPDCRDPEGWTMLTVRPCASWLRRGCPMWRIWARWAPRLPGHCQTEAEGILYHRKVDADSRCSGVCRNVWPDKKANDPVSSTTASVCTAVPRGPIVPLVLTSAYTHQNIIRDVHWDRADY